MTPQRMVASADQGGMILVSVLAVVALSSLVVLLMISSQDPGLQRSTRLREAAQAAAIARGGELSAVVALRRDAIEAPAADHLREPWASVAETGAQIAGGSFDLAVEDAQSRFNLNVLATGGLEARDLLARIVADRRLPPALATAITAYVGAFGPLTDMAELRRVGVDDAVLARLAEVTTVLPTTTTINVNTANEALLALLFRNDVTARVLALRRARSGALTADDLTAARAILPPGAGYTSSYFWVVTDVRVGDTRQRLTSLLARRAQEGRVEVVPILRRIGGAES